MLMWLLGLGALACLIYYVVIAVYSGITTSFAFIWLLFAGGLGLLAAGFRYYRLHPKQVSLWIPVSITTFCCAGLAVFLIVEILVFMGVASTTKPNLDYVIVLGAQVKENGVSNSLKRRLDKAIEYVEQNPETILVLSGGQGPDEPAAEAVVMYDYLVYNGVNPKQLVMETHSTSTVENIAYSKVLIEQLHQKKKEESGKNTPQTIPGVVEQVEDKPLQIGVLTSNFHVFRAEQIAKKWGFSGITGIASSSDPILFPHLCVRECAAILKDKLMGNM